MLHNGLEPLLPYVLKSRFFIPFAESVSRPLFVYSSCLHLAKVWPLFPICQDWLHLCPPNYLSIHRLNKQVPYILVLCWRGQMWNRHLHTTVASRLAWVCYLASLRKAVYPLTNFLEDIISTHVSFFDTQIITEYVQCRVERQLHSMDSIPLLMDKNTKENWLMGSQK